MSYRAVSESPVQSGRSQQHEELTEKFTTVFLSCHGTNAHSETNALITHVCGAHQPHFTGEGTGNLPSAPASMPPPFAALPFQAPGPHRRPGQELRIR